MLYLAAAGCSVGIAVALYPVLSTFSPALAVGAVVFRTIEGVFYTADVVSLLSLGTVGHELATTAPPDRAAHQLIADSLVADHEHAALAGVFAFAAGAFMYYLVFYRSRLIPRWLSVWGIVGVALMLIACLLALFSDHTVTSYVPLAAPIAVQEFVFAGYLLVRGFDPAPSRSPQSSGKSAATPTGSGTSVAMN